MRKYVFKNGWQSADDLNILKCCFSKRHLARPASSIEQTSALVLPLLLTCVYQDFPWVSSKQSGLQRAVSHHLLALYSPWQHLRANIWAEISSTLPGDLNLSAQMALPPSSFVSRNWAEISKYQWLSDHHMLTGPIIFVFVVLIWSINWFLSLCHVQAKCSGLTGHHYLEKKRKWTRNQRSRTRYKEYWTN